MNFLVGGIVLVICCYVSYRCLYKLFKYKHPEKYYGGKVYSVKLSSITPEIKVFKDLSREQNIIDAETKHVADILIQKTSNQNFYREIITGRLIPVSLVKRYGYPSEGYRYEYINYEHYVFVKVILKLNSTGKQYWYWSNEKSPLREISSSDLEKYIDESEGKYKEFDSFSDYLDFIFAQGEKFYNDSLAEGQLSEEAKIQNILKKRN